MNHRQTFPAPLREVSADEVAPGSIVVHAPIDGDPAYVLTIRLPDGQGWYIVGDALPADSGWPWGFCGFETCGVLAEGLADEQAVKLAGMRLPSALEWVRRSREVGQ